MDERNFFLLFSHNDLIKFCFPDHKFLCFFICKRWKYLKKIETKKIKFSKKYKIKRKCWDFSSSCWLFFSDVLRKQKKNIFAKRRRKFSVLKHWNWFSMKIWIKFMGRIWWRLSKVDFCKDFGLILVRLAVFTVWHRIFH